MVYDFMRVRLGGHPAAALRRVGIDFFLYTRQTCGEAGFQSFNLFCDKLARMIEAQGYTRDDIADTRALKRANEQQKKFSFGHLRKCAVRPPVLVSRASQDVGSANRQPSFCAPTNTGALPPPIVPRQSWHEGL